MAAAQQQGQQRRLVALDFDGVVCDSVGESSLSAFKVAMMVVVVSRGW
jgi:predicted Fe-Mo cluster-binding NifX family protein